MAAAGPAIGLRAPAEVAARAAGAGRGRRRAADRGGARSRSLDDVLGAACPGAAYALGHLRDIAVDLPAIAPAVERLARRLDALARAGSMSTRSISRPATAAARWNITTASSSASSAERRPDLPPVATGGRYDALTRVLGQGRAIPAVGGVIRPGLVALLAEGRA